MAQGPDFYSTNPYQSGGSGAPWVASLVSGPAIALMIVSGMNSLIGLFYVGMGLVIVFVPEFAPPDVRNNPQQMQMMQLFGGGIYAAIGVVILTVAAVIFAGAAKMKALQSYGFALTSAILAMIPCISCCLVGLPIGVWAIVMLTKPEVQSAFYSRT